MPTGVIRSLGLLVVVGLCAVGCTKPIGDLCDLRECHSIADRMNIYAEIDLPARPLTFEDVVTITMQRNVEMLIQNIEDQIQAEFTNAAKLRMLPALDIEYDLSYRDSPPASIFRNIATGVQTGGTTNQEQTTNRWDINLAWNILDFGLSYYRARQEADRRLFRQQEALKVRQNLMLDITRAYWRVMTAQKNLVSGEQMHEIVMQRFESTERQVEQRIVSEMEALRREKGLIDMQKVLGQIRYDLESAKRELAGLMGIPPGIEFTLKDVDLEKACLLDYQVSDLEQTALLSRPELFAQDIEGHIAADEVRISILQMFPNARVFGGYSSDKNDLLIFNDWMTVGMEAAYNLLSLPRLNHELKANKGRENLARARRMALSIGILTQVHLTHLRYHQHFQDYELAMRSLDVQRQIFDTAQKENLSGNMSNEELLDIEYETIVTGLETWQVYSELMITTEQLNNAIGRPFAYGHHSCRGNLAEIHSPGRPYTSVGPDKEEVELSWETGAVHSAKGAAIAEDLFDKPKTRVKAEAKPKRDPVFKKSKNPEVLSPELCYEW